MHIDLVIYSKPSRYPRVRDAPNALPQPIKQRDESDDDTACDSREVANRKINGLMSVAILVSRAQPHKKEGACRSP